jgi:hypothetical protein
MWVEGSSGCGEWNFSASFTAFRMTAFVLVLDDRVMLRSGWQHDFAFTMTAKYQVRNDGKYQDRFLAALASRFR